jgi:hypothetical protein
LRRRAGVVGRLIMVESGSDLGGLWNPPSKHSVKKQDRCGSGCGGIGNKRNRAAAVMAVSAITAP